MFRRDRDADYEEIAAAAELVRGADTSSGAPAAELARLSRRLEEVTAIDYCGAPRRDVAVRALAALETRVRPPSPAPDVAPGVGERPVGRTWVTREGVHVDRIASAWLLRRFIDPAARFRFVRAEGYQPAAGELRFDMFDAEFTHEGDRCTFEVLLDRAGLKKDRGLVALAEIVHDIDLKDGKFERPEAEGIRTLIAGICNGTQEDEDRLTRGGAVFDDLYRSFGGPRSRTLR
jgi:hypothetical protein